MLETSSMKVWDHGSAHAWQLESPWLTGRESDEKEIDSFFLGVRCHLSFDHLG